MGRAVQKPSAWVDALLMSAFVAELGVVGYTLRNEPDMLLLLFVLLPVVAIAVWLTKMVFYYGGGFFSRKFLQHLGDPLKKRLAMKKWCDQSWQLAIHVSMAYFEFVVLRDETWWEDTKSMWNQGSKDGVFPEQKFRTKLLYLVQLAIWIYTAFSCKFLEEIRKDYIVMMTHHIVTIALVTWSYAVGYLPVGVVVLFIHDLSDVPLDMMKMANHLKMEGFGGLFATEILFVVLIVDWIYFRMYLFPVNVIKSTLIENRESCMPLAEAHDFTNLTPCVPSWFLFNALLITLFFLHIWWGFLIIRVAVGVITKGAHETGKEEYEGTSDSDSDSKED
ncbi:hypothetical protein Poli38472_000734 [Pythium oligandrum]|uniref:TLC domain-containing protein n=1 Tax=Pythium oligandrum TaxID=41045 RepID=A0A8K1FIE3_PYTOL|nr:hypothetical protein Poli38472_000734 [Pythium oligandrum]|eukprot:TMW60692.1 hypothetical protein Poli38472_000734 [Pythium oligandrum]